MIEGVPNRTDRGRGFPTASILLACALSGSPALARAGKSAAVLSPAEPWILLYTPESSTSPQPLITKSEIKAAVDVFKEVPLLFVEITDQSGTKSAPDTDSQVTEQAPAIAPADTTPAPVGAEKKAKNKSLQP